MNIPTFCIPELSRCKLDRYRAGLKWLILKRKIRKNKNPPIDQCILESQDPIILEFTFFVHLIYTSSYSFLLQPILLRRSLLRTSLDTEL